MIRIPIQQPEEVHGRPQSDMMKNYFPTLIKTPDRARLLGVCKMMMTVLKANNTKAKYPLELLCMLVQQYYLLPLQEACQVLQACFVNIKGFKDSHIAADQQMEWIVKINKAHIKQMCDIPWYTVPTGNTLSLMSALYLWATLGCGVFGCHGNLV